MKLTAFDAPFPPDNNPIVDPKTGTFVISGRNLARALWNRTGQGSGVIPSVGFYTATGNSQLTAAGLEDDWNEVDTVPAGAGVQIPLIPAGLLCVVMNAGANLLRVYPVIGTKIDALAVNTPYQLASTKMQVFQQWGLTQLRSMQLG